MTALSLYHPPNVIVMRHFRTTSNVQGILQGQTNTSELTREGITQGKAFVESLRPYFEGRQVEIWCSNLPRALDTAKIAADILKVSTEAIHIDPSLTEANFGCFEGKNPEHFKNDPACLPYKQNPFLNALDPKGESYQTVAIRVQEAFIRIAERATENTAVLIITHAGAIRSVLMKQLPKNGHPAQYHRVPNPKHNEIYVFDKSSQILAKTSQLAVYLLA